MQYREGGLCPSPGTAKRCFACIERIHQLPGGKKPLKMYTIFKRLLLTGVIYDKKRAKLHT